MENYEFRNDGYLSADLRYRIYKNTHTGPDRGYHFPLKSNVLDILWGIERIDYQGIYEILKDRIPANKDKFRPIKRAIQSLMNEGLPIIKTIDKNGVAWFSLSDSYFPIYIQDTIQLISNAVSIHKSLGKEWDFVTFGLGLFEGIDKEQIIKDRKEVEAIRKETERMLKEFIHWLLDRFKNKENDS